MARTLRPRASKRPALTLKIRLLRPVAAENNDALRWKYLYYGSKNVLLDRRKWARHFKGTSVGEILLPGPPQGNLATVIHPIFAPQNWPLQNFNNTEGAKLWTMLTPALQLATNLLLSEPALAFFRHVKYGREERDLRTGRTNIVAVPSELTTSQQNEAVRYDLLIHATRFNILFGVFSGADDETGQVHAAHCVSQDEFGISQHIAGDLKLLPPNDGKTHYIVVNEAYKVWIQRGKYTPCELLRFNFILAISIVHELGHAFYARNRTDGHEDYEEPFFNVDQHGESAELGAALEQALFGVFTQAVIHPELGVSMEWEHILKETLTDGRVVHVPNYCTFFYSHVWLYKFFMQEFWDGLECTMAPFEVFFLGDAEVAHGACLDPHDRLLRWGVRDADPRFRKNQKTYVIGEDRLPLSDVPKQDVKEYISKLEVLDLYEEPNQEQLQSAVEAAETARRLDIAAAIPEQQGGNRKRKREDDGD